MILPRNGSIIIIDDDPKQALPIIKALSKKGIAVTYYNGITKEELPDKPVQNIRLAFVDLQLLATDNDGHTIATRIVNILKKIIVANNGPYVLLIWSLKSNQYAKALKEEINKPENGIIPTCIVELEKSKCINKKTIQENGTLVEFRDCVLKSIDKSFDKEDLKIISDTIEQQWIVNEHDEFEVKDDAIEVIEQSIETELKKAGVFHLFVIWENLMKESGSCVVSDLCSTIEYSKQWEPNMRDIIHRLAAAKLGKNGATDKQVIVSSLSTLSSTFTEELEAKIREIEFPEYIDLSTKYNISGGGNDGVFQILRFFEDGEKVKLFKDDKEVKGKEKISFKKINALWNGLSKDDQAVVEKLVSTYSTIPLLINTRLHLELNPSDELIPGNVYKVPMNDDLKKKYLTSYFTNVDDDLNDYFFIELEVSPICDYAQAKWKKSRIVSGVLYTTQNKVNSSLENLYSVDPTLLIDGKPSRLVFDSQLFKSLSHEKVKGKELWFRIKREILLDIIAHLASHVNRPGISFVS